MPTSPPKPVALPPPPRVRDDGDSPTKRIMCGEATAFEQVPVPTAFEREVVARSFDDHEPDLTKRIMPGEATAFVPAPTTFERDVVSSVDDERDAAQESKRRRVIQDDEEEDFPKQADESSEVSEPARQVAQQADDCSEVSEPPRQDPSVTIGAAQQRDAIMDSAEAEENQYHADDDSEQRDEDMDVEDANEKVEQAEDVSHTRDQSEAVPRSMHASEERLVRCGRALRDASARLAAYAERLGCADVTASIGDVAGHVERVLHDLQGDEEYTRESHEEEQVRSKRRLSTTKAKQKKTTILDDATVQRKGRHPKHNWWSILWKHLMKAHGWTWKRGKGVVDWYYLRPGCPWPPTSEAQLGEDYFDSVAAMYEVADRENLWVLVDGSSPAAPSHSVDDARPRPAAKESHRVDGAGPAHSAKKRPPKNARRSSTAKRSRSRGDDDEPSSSFPDSKRSDLSRESSEPLRQHKFNLSEAWRECEREGWTYAWSRGYVPSSYGGLYDVVWLKPGVTSKTALVDYNVFLSPEAVVEHRRTPQPTYEYIVDVALALNSDIASRLANGELDLEKARRWLAEVKLEQKKLEQQSTDLVRTTRHGTIKTV